MFGYDSKVLLRDMLVNLGQQEMEIEDLRQKLCSIPDFDPYVAFKRISYSENVDLIDEQSLEKFMKENQYTDLHGLDFAPVVQYFALGARRKALSYQEFLGLVLPCANPILRSHVIQLQQCAVRPPAYSAVDGASHVKA